MTTRVLPGPFTLAPGSFAARSHGCTCDGVRNQFGRGEGEKDRRIWYVDSSCPAHNQPAPARGRGDAHGVGA